MTTHFHVKRIYETAAEEDGARILADRLWPRGISREKAAIDEWAKELAPSPELRKWFGHTSPKWEEFQRRYGEELAANAEAAAALLERHAGRPITLLTATRDREHNHALVLAAFLAELAGC